MPLDELLDLPAARREAVLRRTCGEDAALRGEVERLLAACLREDDIASEPAVALLAPLLGDVDARPRDGPQDLEPGDRVGRFQVSRTLARGGMGVVYLARDPEPDRPVALKLLPLHLTPDPEARRRLMEEARAAAALDHPRIETVYEVGTTSDGRLFIAMACYEGETLRERLKRGPLPLGVAVARCRPRPWTALWGPSSTPACCGSRCRRSRALSTTSGSQRPTGETPWSGFCAPTTGVAG